MGDGAVGTAYQFGSASNYTHIDNNGRQTMVGSARTTRWIWCPSNAIQAAGVKPATRTVNDNGFAVLSFADGQEQETQANILMKNDMDTTASIYVCLGWSSPTVSQNCDWNLTYLITAENESTDTAGTALQTYAASSATANGFVLTTFEITEDQISDSDMCLHLVVWRDGDDGSDNLGAVAELHGIAIRYTANCLGAAP